MAQSPQLPPEKSASRTAKARVGALSRAVRNGERPAADLDAARQELRDARAEEYIRAALAASPPLSEDASHRIAALLTGGAG